VFRDILLGEKPYRKRNPITDCGSIYETDRDSETSDRALEPCDSNSGYLEEVERGSSKRNEKEVLSDERK
jgi:hypothetical protein